jgi:hypothetical protein
MYGGGVSIGLPAVAFPEKTPFAVDFIHSCIERKTYPIAVMLATAFYARIMYAAPPPRRGFRDARRKYRIDEQ